MVIQVLLVAHYNKINNKINDHIIYNKLFDY